MGYFNLHNTLSSDFVDPAVALSNNWNAIDSKLKALDTGISPVGTNIISPVPGLECVSSLATPPNVGVYTGTAWQGIDTVDNWPAFTNLNLQTGFSGVTSWTPQIRLSDKGRVQLKGRIQYNSGNGAWPSGWQLVHAGQFPTTQYAPGVTHIRNIVATPMLTTTWAYALIFVSNADGFLKIWINYVGSAKASGNYVSLNDVEWWAN